SFATQRTQKTIPKRAIQIPFNDRARDIPKERLLSNDRMIAIVSYGIRFPNSTRRIPHPFTRGHAPISIAWKRRKVLKKSHGNFRGISVAISERFLRVPVEHLAQSINPAPLRLHCHWLVPAARDVIAN